MRIESSVAAISWIPSEAVEGLAKLPFEVGFTHYDQPPPDTIEDLEALRQADRFREANELRAFITVEDGRLVDCGHLGGGRIGATTVRVGPAAVTFPAVHLPDLRPEPVVGPTSVRFVQTVGGRMGLPAPRSVPRKPYLQVWSAIAWTTLALTINVDGSSAYEVVGASRFPRHWIYDSSGKLVAKTGLIDFRTWFKDSFGEHTPWGAYDSPALVTAVESALERQLSRTIMRGARSIRTLAQGETLVEEGALGQEIYLLLDGVMEVEVSGRVIAEIGPGAILGERAFLEGGRRTATLRAATRGRVAATSPDQIKLSDLSDVASRHQRENDRSDMDGPGTGSQG
jgi:cyclic nucleotide-binding protein